jgi:hypothetical protein
LPLSLEMNCGPVCLGVVGFSSSVMGVPTTCPGALLWPGRRSVAVENSLHNLAGCRLAVP